MVLNSRCYGKRYSIYYFLIQCVWIGLNPNVWQQRAISIFCVVVTLKGQGQGVAREAIWDWRIQIQHASLVLNPIFWRIRQAYIFSMSVWPLEVKGHGAQEILTRKWHIWIQRAWYSLKFDFRKDQRIFTFYAKLTFCGQRSWPLRSSFSKLPYLDSSHMNYS